MDHWDIDFRGISIWGYFRAFHNDKEQTRYKPRLRFGFSDIFGLLSFIFLPFSNKEAVFICGRKDLLEFVSHYFSKGSYILFIRDEKIKGNVFFIEALRYFFRVFCPYFFLKERSELVNKVIKVTGKDESSVTEIVDNVIGDYFFNKFISCLLASKQVYYTGCVVPPLERYMGLMSSCEIQHGIIYKGHLDYTDIPKEIINNKLLLWSKDWEPVIRGCNYGGNVIYGAYSVVNLFKEQECEELFDVIIYTTVNEEFSSKVNSFYKKYGGLCRVAVQKHPRDYYGYEIPNSVFHKYLNPKAGNKIYISDSTLILSFVNSGVFFNYLPVGGEEFNEICSRLFMKYNAIIDKDYSISPLSV